MENSEFELLETANWAFLTSSRPVKREAAIGMTVPYTNNMFSLLNSFRICSIKFFRFELYW